MKMNLFETLVVPTLVYAALLLAMLLLPLFLNARHDTVTALGRYLDTQPPGTAHRGYLRMPGSEDAPGAPASRQVPIDRAIPDAKIIARPAAKLRLKTVQA
jgi:hypothetical protein